MKTLISCYCLGKIRSSSLLDFFLKDYEYLWGEWPTLGFEFCFDFVYKTNVSYDGFLPCAVLISVYNASFLVIGNSSCVPENS